MPAGRRTVKGMDDPESHAANAGYYIGAARMKGNANDDPVVLAALARAEAALAVADAIDNLASAVREVGGLLPSA